MVLYYFSKIKVLFILINIFPLFLFSIIIAAVEIPLKLTLSQKEQ